MYVFEDVDTYLHALAYTESYTEQPTLDREKLMFTAYERLAMYFDDAVLTDKVVALQTLYMIEGEGDEFAKMKRQGVKSFNLKGISFSFDATGGTSGISPDALALIDTLLSANAPAAGIGRLI